MSGMGASPVQFEPDADYGGYDDIATALLEFQIPPQIQRHASFMFSFIGRGVCESYTISLPVSLIVA